MNRRRILYFCCVVYASCALIAIVISVVPFEMDCLADWLPLRLWTLVGGGALLITLLMAVSAFYVQKLRKTSILPLLYSTVACFQCAWTVIGLVLLATVPRSCEHESPALWTMAVLLTMALLLQRCAECLALIDHYCL